MRRNKYKLTVTSPKSVGELDISDDVDDFENSNQPLFSVLRPSKFPSKERILYLWKRARILLRAFARLVKVWKDIQLYGSRRNHLEKFVARKESIDVPESEKGDPYLFSPNTSCYRIWSIVLICILVYTAMAVPYRLSFTYDGDQDWMIVDSFIDVLFFIDILITFNCSYYDKEMKLIQNRKIVVLNYLKTWFLIDVVSCVPFQFFFDDQKQFNKLARLSRVPRITKILRLFKMLKFIKSINSVELIRRFVEFLNISESVVRMFKFLGAIIMVVHINACFWHLIARMEDLNYENWVRRYQLNDTDKDELYLISVYFVMQTIVTIGFGDVVPKTLLERSYTLFLLMIGVGFYSYIIGNLSSIVQTLESDSSALNRKLNVLREFSKDQNIDRKIFDKIRRYLEINGTTEKYDKNALIRELPGSLKKLVTIHTHKKIVERIYFFQDKDEMFISRFVGKLVTTNYTNGKTIFYKGDYADEVFFISKGRIILKGKYGSIVKNFMQGAYFGELEVLNKENPSRKYTAQVASPKATLSTISKKDFNLILKEFPEVEREVKATARIREQRIEETDCEILQSFLTNRGELNKAKTSHDGSATPSKVLKTISRTGWKLFLKNSLSVEVSRNVPWKPDHSVWEDYEKFRDKKGGLKHFIARNSLTELFDRAKFNMKPSALSVPPGLNKEIFAKSFLRPRVSYKVRGEYPKDPLEPGNFTPDLSLDDSRERTQKTVAEVLQDLFECQQLAEEKFSQVADLLQMIHKDELAIKDKLENFFVSK
jgi:CRP-like cAMP-binding protein